uniref:Peter pan homolog n=1 Tax=Latimeria chalumnae TaxID=7897 RepID=H2ZW53_LATCH
MGKRSKTKSQKKARENAIHLAQEEFSGVPHSFVFHRGQVGKNMHQLIEDVRRAMEPYTAVSLKVRKKNTLKDFISIAGPIGVTHFLVFSKTETNVNFKLARLPKGPTLSFKVLQYSLVKDVVSSLKRHRMHDQQFTHYPLVVLNNFGTEGMHIKLMATMFQNLFPSINVHKVNLNAIKRCILINYNPDTQLIDFRHYSIKVVPVGMSKGMKKLLQEKFPNMSKFEDISELLMKAHSNGGVSRQAAEGGGASFLVRGPGAVSRGGEPPCSQHCWALVIIGPRMTLQLVKIEEGLSEGDVLYHSFGHKSEEEIKAMLERKEKKLRLKEERRKKQDSDLKRKQEEREANKNKSLEGIRKKKLCQKQEEGDSDAEDPGMAEDQKQDDHSDYEADLEYYRQEVGVEPDEDLFPGAKRKRGSFRSLQPKKKFKKSREVAGNKKELRGEAAREGSGQKMKPLGKNKGLLGPKFKGTA